MAFIYYLSGQPTTGIGGNELNRFLVLKSFHLIEYAILAMFLFLAFRRASIVIIISYLYALSDEFHQSFVPNREGRFRDTLIDLVGIFIGLLLWRWLNRISFYSRHRLG
jgi:VanZ family protein